MTKPLPLGSGYFCHLCRKYFVKHSEPMQRQVLAESYDEGTVEDDVMWNTSYGCHDGGGKAETGACPCWSTDEDYFESVDDVWQCDSCESRYRNFSEAVDCCR